ncbi:N(4)-acetylcytidine aminohydrolase [Shewanella salipaludis]|uniref:N(4)-acetylcytidine amidohydrolase n=1 Tax=Shewanella salipaludis TaxID=2723052 RepID=A0A972FX80_9GAMM|nr:N(4)-acetylcytidine aminohydrolase [Shewanella salipaludis]NMH64322.1 ASCH domain-containing protein [Shewanella salipaludis]
MTRPLKQMTFYHRFEKDILSGAKTITIRNHAEADFLPGEIVSVSTFETGRWFCNIQILSVTPLEVDDIDERHALQENMPLDELLAVISRIYPDEKSLYMICFKLC